MISFWEQESIWEYEVLIVGAGIVGLSVAAAIAESYPRAKILVVEQYSIPGGASLRNAGFACFGSFTEVLEDIENMGKEEALKLIMMRYEGLQITRKRLGDQKIDFQQVGGYELITAADAAKLNELETINEWLHSEFALYLYREASAQIKSFGFNEKLVSTLLFNPLEGHLNTGKMMSALHAYVVQKGVKVVYGCKLDLLQNTSMDQDSMQLMVDGKQYKIKCKSLIMCTNAFSKNLLPAEDIRPGRGLILVTEPLATIPFQGTFHFDRGYYYFRDLGKRILIGGGRHLDVEGETTLDQGVNPLIYNGIQALLREVIVPEKELKIDYTWSGAMAFGAQKKPIIKKIGKGQYAAVRMGGMGVAIAGKVGTEVAGMVKDDLA